MAYQQGCGSSFLKFLEARFATAFTFQQCFCSCKHSRNEDFFRENHRLYGLKVEVLVTANGLAIGCTKFYPGHVSDIKNFQENLERH